MDQELFNRVMASFDEEREPKRSVGDWAKDIGLTAAKGVVGAGEGVAGLANMATLGLSGRGLKALGYDPKATKEWLGQFHSEAHKKAQQNVSEAGKQAWQNVKDEVQGGSWRDPEVYKAIGREAKDVGRALIENPSIVASSIGESIPTMFAGGAIGKGIRALGAASKAAPKVGAWLAKPGVAGAIGEGVIGAGAAAEQIRQESPDENLTAKGALYAGLTGLGTGVLGRLGNKAMGKMGIADIEEMLAGGTRAVGKAGQKLTLGQAAKGVVGGAIGEGLFEELPQSAQETVLQNIATGKPWYEGLGESMVQGAFAGGVMGGGANVYSALPAQQRKAMAAHEAERRAERQALAQSALGNAYAQASPGVMEATSALAAQGPDDLTPAQKLAELKAELGEQLDRKDAGQGLVGLLRRAQEQKARQEAAEERAAFSGTQYADLAQPTTEEIARQNIRVTPENSVLAEGGATEVGRAVEDRLGRQEAAASAEAERSAIADMYRRLFGYEETGEGIPVDEANSRLARGEATEAGRREETRLAEREKEAERLAARQEDLETAFSQPATTPRYEAVALEDADIAARQRKTERQAREQERIAALSQRTWEPGNVPPELAERLDGLRRQMDAGEAGQKFFTEGEDGELHVTGMASTNPVWMRRPGKQEAEADPDRALLSSVGKKEIRNVLDKGGRGETLTDRQQEIWSALQRKAWRHGTDDYDAQGIGQEYEDYQYAAKRGINLEAPREVAAGSLQNGDTVLVRDREGEIDAASVSTDPSTGTVTIRDGVVRRYGYGDPVQIEGLKPVERTESPIVSMLMAEQQAQRQARDAELEAQAASGTIGKALAAGDILIGEQQPGLGIGALMGATEQETPEARQEMLADAQSAEVGNLTGALRQVLGQRQAAEAAEQARRQAAREGRTQRKLEESKERRQQVAAAQERDARREAGLGLLAFMRGQNAARAESEVWQLGPAENQAEDADTFSALPDNTSKIQKEKPETTARNTGRTDAEGANTIPIRSESLEKYSAENMPARDKVLAAFSEATGIPLEQLQAEYDAVAERYEGQPKKAPNSEPTNLTPEQWILARTPSFLRRYGNWAYNPDAPVAVVDMGDISEIAGFTETKELREWAKAKYRNTSVTIASDGAIAGFTVEGIKKSLKATRNDKDSKNAEKNAARNAVYARLNELVKSAIFYGYEKGDGAANHQGVIGQDIYVAAMKLGEQTYAVRFKFDIFAENAARIFRDRKVAEISISLAVNAGIAPNRATAATNKGYAFKIGDLLAAVKQDAGDVQPIAVSLDANGEPVFTDRGTVEQATPAKKPGGNDEGGTGGAASGGMQGGPTRKVREANAKTADEEARKLREAENPAKHFVDGMLSGAFRAVDLDGKTYSVVWQGGDAVLHVHERGYNFGEYAEHEAKPHAGMGKKRNAVNAALTALDMANVPNKEQFLEEYREYLRIASGEQNRLAGPDGATYTLKLTKYGEVSSIEIKEADGRTSTLKPEYILGANWNRFEAAQKIFDHIKQRQSAGDSSASPRNDRQGERAASGGTQAQAQTADDFARTLKEYGSATNTKGTTYELQELKGNPGKFRVNATTRYGERVAVTNKGLPLNEALEYAQNISAEESGGVNLRVAVRAARENAGRQDAEQAEQQAQTPAQEAAPENPERQAFIDKLRRTGPQRSRATGPDGQTYNIDERGGRYTAFDGDGNVVGSFDSHEAAVTALADRAFPATAEAPAATGEATAEAWQSTVPQSAIDAEAAGISDADLEALAEDVFGPTALNEPEPKPGEKKPRTKTGKPRPKKKVTDVPLKQRAQAAKRTNQDLKSAREKLAQAAAASGKSGEQAIKEAFSGLMTLFTPKNTFGSGIVFTEESYQAAKPHFIAAWRNCQQMGLNIREFFAALKDVFGAAIAPFAVRFVQDVRDGKINMEEDNGGKRIETGEREEAGGIAGAASLRQDDAGLEADSAGALEAVPSEMVGRDGRGQPDSGSDRGGAKDAGRDSGADAEGIPVPRGGRDGAGEVHTGEAGAGRRGGKRGVKTGEPDPNQTTSPAAIPAQNFRITDALELGKGGPVQKYNDNIAAIRTLKQIQRENRRATPEEQAILARYVGWGGLADAFRRPDGSVKEGWEKRVAEVEALLSPKELKTARSSTQNAHYTSQDVVRAIWRGMTRLGFKGGNVLEPSVGTGNFLGLMPQELAGKTRFTAAEFDNTTAAIAQLLYPNENIRHTPFEKLPIASGAIDAMVGNPPFGSTKLVFPFKPHLNRHSIHNQFVLSSLESLRPGGVMGFVVSRYLMDNQDDSVRREIAGMGKLLGAIRLPGTAFKGNAGTEVVTDIIFLQRYTKEEQEAYDPSRTPEWLGTTDMLDDKGQNPMPVNNWFVNHPEWVLGELNRQGSMWRENDIGVTYKGDDLAGDLNRMIDAVLPQNVATGFEPKRSEQAHQEMVENMNLMLSGRAEGDVSFDENGGLVQVYERESVTGGDETVLTTRVLTPESPWSETLTQTADGRWYEEVDKLGPNGKPVKARGKDGRLTNRNQKERRYYTEAEIPDNKRLGETGYDRLKDATRLLEVLDEQIRLETANESDEAIEANRKKLNRAYDAFVQKHKGYLNEPHNAKLIEAMPNGPKLLALEANYRKKTKDRPAEAVKADILSRRVNFPAGGEVRVRDANDALGVNLSEMGRVDIGHMARLLGKSPEDVAAELCDDAEKPLIFFDPESQLWTKADEYLSGNVRRKLNAAIAARDAAAANGASARELKRLEKAVSALEEVQPKRWESHQITPMPGAAWIPPDVYADFYAHLTGGKATVTYSALTHTFGVSVSETGGMESTWSTPDRSAASLLDHLLNSRSVTVTYRDSDGKTRTDTEASQAGNDKVQEIKEEFSNWVFQDADRRERLTDIFNDRYNVRVVKQNDGSHLKLPGKVPDSIIKMRRHQLNAIWRGVVDRFVLYDHAVGAGKTFTGIARAMERRRMGLSRKPMIVVPNHLVNQFAKDVYKLYPAAKVLAAGKADMERSKRRRLFGRIATGDWDIVIVPHSSFGFIGIDPSTEESYIEQELEQVYEAIVELKEQDKAEGGRGKSPAVKAAEALRDRLEARLEKIRAKGNKKDRLLTFEQMGVDDLTVDEAHEFKNLFYNSNLKNCAGMNPRAGSTKAYDLWTKLRVLRESGGSAAFMTGTPISNSAVEMYTMMRYLAADELAELDLEHFDAWRAQFVDVSTAYEPTESGSGLKEVTRLGRDWSNMRSLMDLYYSFADCVSNEDIQQWYLEDTGEEFPLPKVKGGGRQPVNVEPTPEQWNILHDIISGFNGLKGIRNLKERNATRLRLMDRARKVSLDARVVEPKLSAEEGGKLAAVTERVFDLYKKFDKVKGTQLVFLDRSVPKANGDAKRLEAYDKLLASLDAAEREGDEEAARKAVESLDKYDANEMEEIRLAQNGGWNAYQQIKDNLVALGIPANEIRFVQEANTDAQKQDLFDAVKRGEVRVLLGSSQRMGAGTNVQDRLVALHHVDVGWKPSDIEQREGRIIRQGNLFATEGSELYDPNFQVEILAYTTERTVDAKMWALNSTKLKMINGIRKYGGEFNMEFDDSDSVGMAEIAAIASGDPLQLERVQLDGEITKLERQKRAFQRQRFATQDAIKKAERTIKETPGRIAYHEKYGPKVKAGIEEERAWKAGLSVVIDGETYTGETRKAAFDLVARAARETNETQGRKALSIEIDGEKYHAQSKAEDALERKLGDNGPFVAELDGERFASGSLVRRKIAERVNAAVKGKPDELDDIRIGVIKKGGLEFELSFSTEMTTDRRGTPYKAIHFYFDQKVDGKEEMAERITDSYSGAFLPGGDTLNLASIPGLFNEIGKATAALTGDVTRLRKQLEQAEKSLPALREEAAKEWPKQGELEEKKKRLAEVEQILNAQAKAAESGSAASLRDEIEAGAGIDFEGAIIPDSRAGDAARLSVAAVPVGGRADIEAELASSIGKTWANKILRAKNGNVRIIETQEEARRMVGANNETVKRSESGTIQGFYLNGVAYLVRDGIAKGNVMGVLMHEYGEHAAQLGFADNVGYRAILASIKNRQNENSETGKAIREAMKRVPEGTKPEHYWNEVVAYLVEANANIKTTALDRITHFFRKWLHKITGLGADNFTHKDLVLFARAAVKAAGREKARGSAESFDSRGETLQPAFMSMKDTKERMIAAAAEQMGVPLEQLQAEYEAVAKRHERQPRNAPNGEASKLTEEQWILARTPSFLRKYGNWAYNPDASVEPVDLSGVTLDVDYRDTNALKKWLFNKYAGQTVTIDSDGAVVGFSTGKLDDSLKRRGKEQRTVYAKLDELIKSSIYFDFEQNDGQSKHINLTGQDIYYAAMKIGDKTYSVLFRFNITKKTFARTYKDHKVVDIEISPAVNAGEAQQGSAPPRSGDKGKSPHVYHASTKDGAHARTGDGKHSSLVYHAQAQNDSGASHARTEDVLPVTLGDLTGGVKPGNVSIPLDANGEPTADAFPSTTDDGGGPNGGQSANGPLFSIAAPSSPTPNPANNNAVTGQSFIDRILANAAPKWRDRWERFIYNFLDSNDPRERVWKRAGSPSDKDFVTIERLRGKKAAAEQKRFKREMLDPLLDTLGKAGLSVSDLEEYAHALHTPERNQRMREQNAKRTLDELIKNMPERDAQDIKDQIDFIREQGKANGWTESDIQKAYLDLMRDVFNNIPAREQAQRAAERALSPNSSQAEMNRVAKGAEQLAETKRIRDKWQEESVRFAGMTDAEAASIIQKWQGDGKYSALQKAQRQLAAINAATLDVLHEAGELGDEEYQAMKNGYQFYVPLHRDGFQDTRPPAVGRSTGPIGSPFKVAKGSMRAVVNILANSVQAHETAINRRHKLEAGRALYEFAKAHPDAGITVERQEKKPTHDKEGNIVMYTSQAEPEDGVFVKVDGVKYLLRFNTDNSTPEGRTLARFLDSVKGADAQLGGMVKMLHQATRWLAAVNTSFSPEFVVTNFSRDFQTAFIHLNQKGIDMDGLKRAVAKDVFPAMRGIFAAERGNRNGAMARWYADYEANGGKVGWMQSYENIGDLANEIQQELKLHQKGHHGYKAWRAMTALVENGNAAIENCMRLATYKALVERGVSRQKAAMVASSLTVDFTQRGKMSPQINALYMFFNASVQGTVRMVQAMATSRKVQAIAGGIAGAGFVLQMLALAGGGDDDSGEPNIFGIPESTRERNIIIMLPGGDGKRYIKIPKAYGYGALYDFGAELANSIYMSANGRKYDHAAGAMRVVSSFANSFNPIQSATLLQALSPTLLDPVVYTAENKSWAGTPLMPEQSPYGPSKPDSYRAWKGTSPIFKKMAESWSGLFGGDSYSPGRFAAFTDISPETFSMLWDTGTGGMGRFVGNVVSLPFSAMEGEVESRKIPFLRQVYGEWNDRAISSRYYEAMDRAEVAHMRFKNAENLAERKRLYQEPDHKLYLQSRESEKRIKAMRKRQQLMEAAGNKDGAERMRQRIVEEQAKVLKMAA